MSPSGHADIKGREGRLNCTKLNWIGWRRGARGARGQASKRTWVLVVHDGGEEKGGPLHAGQGQQRARRPRVHRDEARVGSLLLSWMDDSTVLVVVVVVDGPHGDY